MLAAKAQENTFFPSVLTEEAKMAQQPEEPMPAGGPFPGCL